MVTHHQLNEVCDYTRDAENLGFRMQIIGSMIVQWDENKRMYMIIPHETFYTCDGILRHRAKTGDQEEEKRKDKIGPK